MSLKKEVESLKEEVESQKKKPKKFRLPGRGKVSKGQVKKGYLTILVVNENGAVDFRKEPLKDSTVKIRDNENLTFHAVNPEDVLSYNGKPFVIIPRNKKNPYNPSKGDNQTYGDKYILARMESEGLSLKKKLGGLGMSIAGLVVGGIILYSVFFGA